MKLDGDEFVVKYCNNSSILVINKSGKLRQVFTPFRVTLNKTNVTKRHVFIVDEVQQTKDDKLVYVINGNPYYHTDFIIEIQF